MAILAHHGAPPAGQTARWVVFLEWLAVLAVFFFHAGWPVPEPNEPHYLCKAKHYWQPTWLADDMFLASTDAHYLFYLTCGWPTRWLELETVAWCGRLLSWAGMAWAWRRLSAEIVPVAGLAAVSAALFVGACEWFQMAGEWVLGGFEAKPLAYVCVLAAVAALVRARWFACWLWLGLATAIHVVVGGWASLAALGVAMSDRRLAWSRLAAGLSIWGGLMLIGLVPALRLAWGVDSASLAEANRIYMDRLSHHLDLTQFQPWFVVRHLLLIAGWFALCRSQRAAPRMRRLRRFVAGVLAISLTGAVINLWLTPESDLQLALLRFYWYRLSDVIVPVAVALEAVRLARPRRWLPPARRTWQVTVVVLAAWQVAITVPRPWAPYARADKPGKVLSEASWREACHWIRDHTPADAVFLTPRTCQTFKWHAQRSEVVTWKDVPQNARSLIAWRHRIEAVFRDHDPRTRARYHDSPGSLAPERIERLAADYVADYLVAECAEGVPPDLPFALVYAGGDYAVFRIRGAATAGGPAAGQPAGATRAAAD